MSGLVFFGLALSSFGFCVDVVFGFLFCFLRKSSGSNRTPPHTHWFCLLLFLLFVPPRLVYRPFWPCVLSLGVFSGCHSGPRAFFFDSPGTCGA